MVNPKHFSLVTGCECSNQKQAWKPHEDRENHAKNLETSPWKIRTSERKRACRHWKDRRVTVLIDHSLPFTGLLQVGWLIHFLFSYSFFFTYDHDKDHRIHRDELKEFIETLNFGVPLDHDAIFDELAKDFDKDNNCDTIDKNDFVEGFMRWIDKAIKHDPSIKDPKHAIAKFEEVSYFKLKSFFVIRDKSCYSHHHLISSILWTLRDKSCYLR